MLTLSPLSSIYEHKINKLLTGQDGLLFKDRAIDDQCDRRLSNITPSRTTMERELVYKPRGRIVMIKIKIKLKAKCMVLRVSDALTLCAAYIVRDVSRIQRRKRVEKGPCRCSVFRKW